MKLRLTAGCVKRLHVGFNTEDAEDSEKLR